MSDSGLDKFPVDRTPDQARAEIMRKDRAAWFPGRGLGNAIHGIHGPGRVVASATREVDRDSILTMARSHYAMLDALEAALPALEDEIKRIIEAHSLLKEDGEGEAQPVPGTLDEGVEFEVQEKQAVVAQVKAAIAVARGEKR